MAHRLSTGYDNNIIMAILLHTVLHNMHCLRGISVLWMVLVGKEEECCGVDKGVTNDRKCLWVLTVARASMDVVMSVAASVIFSLLLISGDVEENPGPGPGGKDIHHDKFISMLMYVCAELDYNSVDAVQILGMLSSC